MQQEVTEFYDKMVFPSRTSHKAYEDIVPKQLHGLRVGDFGCGESLFINVFRELNYEAFFLDISSNALSRIDYGKRIRGSLTNIPLKDNFMDVIFCIRVVHHIPEMREALRELMRVLKKDSKLYLGVYADKSLQAALRKMYDSVEHPLPRKVMYAVTILLIWIRNRKNGFSFKSVEYDKKTEDLLETPLVRYLPAFNYIRCKRQLKKWRGEVIGIKKISSMRVLYIRKTG